MTKLTSRAYGALVLAVLSALLLIAIPPAHAQQDTVLYSFGTNLGNDGHYPQAGLVLNQAGGLLYGATGHGGVNGNGMVFDVYTVVGGREDQLYSFGTWPDGADPVSGLILVNDTTLYGTTVVGGPITQQAGTVFQVDRKSGQESVLYSFGSSSTDGVQPYGGLVRDTLGNFYGTTAYGGAVSNLGGTVFKITTGGIESILYSFPGNASDGFTPMAGLVMDKLGNLYGTTQYGGANGYGTVFKLTPTGSESILHSFNNNGADGYYPVAGLVMDKKGNLYGTTPYGGTGNVGTVFEITASGSYKVLWSFGQYFQDGFQPVAGLVLDKKRNLYGTTEGGGTNNLGTVFKVTQKGKESIIANLGSTPTDAASPEAGLIFDKTYKILYGTSYGGGNMGYGTVFEVLLP